ncbi:DUF4040 domain-containing protein [Kamptonema formosum]|uniref:DUF4040 domain-containing protein n=1 Tax=Kamptonema formosum TaxID=331992 RepID=UPI00034CE82A|nr:DUF4040 domain-containing protein [Oscillatoria sp. PCC 10802]
MSDPYIYVIIALLPLSASMLLVQSNPYYALIVRGVLGAIAALSYSILGAADVALTEALVGTLLAITLYAVTVRSSMAIRLGVIKDLSIDGDNQFGKLIGALRTVAAKWYMRLELVSYEDTQTMHQALMDREIHAVCLKPESAGDSERGGAVGEGETPPFQTATRIQRLYDIMKTELPSETLLTYVNPSASTPDSAEQHK